jgi:hypothetical protein
MGLVVHLLWSSPGSTATLVADDFETYSPGSFPSPHWLDAGTVAPGSPAPPIPSVTIVSTTNGFGRPTRAVSLVDAIAATPQGIYRTIPVSSPYTLDVDFRIDRFSNGGDTTFQEWAFQAGFLVNDGTSFDTATQVGVYASSVSNDFRLYAINGDQYDETLDAIPTLGTWYHLDFSIDVTTGEATTRIVEIATETVLVERTDSITGWDPELALFDAVAFFDGDQEGGDVSNLSVWDNVVVVVPEPGSALLLAAALAAAHAVARRRRRGGS